MRLEGNDKGQELEDLSSLLGTAQTQWFILDKPLVSLSFDFCTSQMGNSHRSYLPKLL
jgi:hypothetical protein